MVARQAPNQGLAQKKKPNSSRLVFVVSYSALGYQCDSQLSRRPGRWLSLLRRADVVAFTSLDRVEIDPAQNERQSRRIDFDG